MSSNFENSSNSYHGYFVDDPISIDQSPLVVNFTLASFILDNQTNFQSISDWYINKVENKIPEKFISSLIVKYKIPSSIELRKEQIGVLVNQPLP